VGSDAAPRSLASVAGKHSDEDNSERLVTLSEPLPSAEGPSGALETTSPLAGLFPFDLNRLERGADAFFEQLANLGEDEQAACLSARLASWLVVATAVACELVRRRNARAASEAVPGPLVF
jgi:hypothetical protein